VPQIVRIQAQRECKKDIIYTNKTYEDIMQWYGKDLVPFVKSKMIQDPAMLKNKIEDGAIFLQRKENSIFALVNDDDKFLVNRSKLLGCTFGKTQKRKSKCLCFTFGEKEEKIDSIKRLKNFISKEIGLNSHIFEITTETGQQVQNLNEVQDAIYIKKAKNYWKWDLKFYLMCISNLFALADFALDINSITEYFQIGQKDFGIIMIVLTSVNILLRALMIISQKKLENYPFRLLYPILDLDAIIEKYEAWKDGEIKIRYSGLDTRDRFQLIELLLENIPSFFLGLYAMILRGEINISILLSVVSSGALLCNKLISVSIFRTRYLFYQNPSKLKIQILEYFQTAIEFLSRTIILVLFVYVTRPWGA